MIRNLIKLSFGNIRGHKLTQMTTVFHIHRTFSTKDKVSAQPLVEEESKNPINAFTSNAADNTNDKNNEAGPKLDDAERTKRLKVLQLEVDILYQEGRRVPQLSFFEEKHWNHLLTLETKSARTKYYGYLWQIAMKKQSKEIKKEERAIEVQRYKEELRKQREECDHIVYGLGQTTMFLRMYDSTVNNWQNNKLIRAMQFGSKVILDCSYDRYMNRREASNAAKQLCFCFAENRAHDDPFDLHYCNVDMKSVCMQYLERFIPTMRNPDFPMNVHSQCFTELFPKENLVYLTPHCRTDLVEYNHDDIYIIGAMVDTVNNEPLSLAKAKKLGLRMARLPLDRYLHWGSGSGKSLTLNQVINIMLDLKFTGDWEKSLQHVPRRKIYSSEREQYRENRSVIHRANKLNINLDKLMLEDDEDYNYRRRATERLGIAKNPFKRDIGSFNREENKFR